ncbi:MAG: M3 family oligoendopeptidase [Desulfovibrionales bacterium]
MQDAPPVWDLSGLYEHPDDPRISRDMEECHREAKGFSTAYRGKIADLSPADFASALHFLEALEERVARLTAYAFLLYAANVENITHVRLHARVTLFESRIKEQVLFFRLEWMQLPEDRARSLLDLPPIERNRRHLKFLRTLSPHILSEPQERILALKSPAGVKAWVTLFETTLGHARFGPQELTQVETMARLHDDDRSVRRQASEELSAGLAGIGHVQAQVLSTICLDRAIEDELRSYPHWLAERTLRNELTDTSVTELERAVSGSFDLVHRYYALKSEMLGLADFFEYDRFAPLPGCDHRFTWNQAKDLVLEAFANFSPEMARTAERFLQENWVHARTAQGKLAGAFAHPTVPGHHPYIFCNFTGTLDDVFTLAHELGHGVHQYLSRKQGIFNQEPSLVLAETASFMAEWLLHDQLVRNADNPLERLALLCARMEDLIATVFRQVSLHRFEAAMHKNVRETGSADKELLCTLWLDEQRAILGPGVRLSQGYRNWWAYIPHFAHTPGYVHAYAFAQMIVLALDTQRTSGSPEFGRQFVELLSSGGCAAPQTGLAGFGLEINTPKFFHAGIETMERLLVEAEQGFHTVAGR